MTRLLGIKKWIVSDSDVSGIANRVREYLYQRLTLPWASTGLVMVAAKHATRKDRVRTPCGQSGSLRGLELVPSKRC